jgi:hypothetical protein
MYLLANRWTQQNSTTHGPNKFYFSIVGRLLNLMQYSKEFNWCLYGALDSKAAWPTF